MNQIEIRGKSKKALEEEEDAVRLGPRQGVGKKMMKSRDSSFCFTNVKS